jgi:hypothetical protein
MYLLPQLDVLGGLEHQAGVVAEGTEAKVAVVAQKRADFLSLMIVVQVQRLRAAVRPIRLTAPLARNYFLGRLGHTVKCLLISAISNSSRHQPQGTLMEGLPPLFFAGDFDFMESSL